MLRPKYLLFVLPVFFLLSAAFVPARRSTQRQSQQECFHLKTRLSSLNGDYLSSLESGLLSDTSATLTAASEAPSATITASPPRRPGQVQLLKSVDSFLDFIEGAPRDSLVVIKYFGESCPLCRKIEMKYKKMARFYSKAPIQFGEVGRRGAHHDLFSTLGIDYFPHIQIYRNGKCVAAHGTESDKMFEPVVHDTIQRELSMTQADWESFLTAFAEPIRQSTEKLEQVRLLK